MPQILLLIAAGAGVVFARRYIRQAQDRAADDLRAARAAMARQESERQPTPLVRDPATGIYQPKQQDHA